MRVRVLLLGLLIAGCVDPEAPDGTASARPIPWGVERCAFVIAAIPVDEAALAALLPEGFTPRAGTLGPLPAGPRVTIELDAYDCASVSWNGTSIADAGYGSYYTAVTPPDALREDGYDAYFVKFDFAVPDEATRASLASLPARVGQANVAMGAQGVTASLELDGGGGGFSLTGAMQAPPGAPGEPLPFMEFTTLEDGSGLARWHARLHDARIGQGAGVVSLPEGSWVRDLVGAPQAPATFIAGEWNLDEADVSFPIEWP